VHRHLNSSETVLTVSTAKQETVETVSIVAFPVITGLKPGVNETKPPAIGVTSMQVKTKVKVGGGPHMDPNG